MIVLELVYVAFRNAFQRQNNWTISIQSDPWQFVQVLGMGAHNTEGMSVGN